MKNRNNQRLKLKNANTMKFVTNISPGLYRRQWLLFSMAFLLSFSPLFAEGVQKVAPTAGDSPVMLETGRPDFGNFAAFNGPENSRLYVTIGNLNEKIFLALSPEYDDDGVIYPGTFAPQYRFRIRRAIDGVVVHGPFTITTTNANANNWGQTAFGNYSVTTLQSGQLMYQFQPTQLGNYIVEFTDASFPDSNQGQVNIPFWDITVANNGVPIDGRVWSRNWAFRTPQHDITNLPDCDWNRQFNGTLYSYTTDGFVSRIDFADAGMQGLSFNITFNSTGPGMSGDLTEDRKSIPGVNATLNSAEHQIFLSEPDITLFPSGICGQLTSPSSFNCINQDSFCLEVSVTKPGQVEVVLDFNQNGILDPDSEDVTLLYEFTNGNLSDCIPWDGLRGDGTPISVGDTIDLIFFYSQGIQHWSAYDVEFMRNGYCIETIRPTCEPNISSNFLYWDDRNIIADPGTGAVKDGRNGCACETNCRNWDNFNINSPDCNSFNDDATTGYGDKNTINTWWFANTTTARRINVPIVQGTITGIDTICQDDLTTWVASDLGASGNVTFMWTGPNGFTATTADITIGIAGEYCVAIMDDLGCSTNLCKELTVLNPDDGGLVYPTTLSGCLGSMIEIIPTGDLSGYSFAWSPTTGLVGPNTPSPSFTFMGNITYTVTITDLDTDCSYTQTVEITGLIEPEPSFTTMTGCDQGLTVNFTNTSTNGATYVWDFGDLTTVTDISTLENPSYTYPAAGTYTVKLTVTSIDGCVAMVMQEVVVIDVPLIADFTVSYNSCSPDAVEIQFTNTSVNGANNTNAYAWAFSNGNGSSNLENPTLTVNGNQTFSVLLTITTADGCIASTTQDVTINLGPPTDQFPDLFLVCAGDSVQMMPGGDPAFTYSWSPSTGINDTSSPQPFFNPAASTTYTVTITASGADDCVVVETVEVFVPPVIGLEVSGGGNFCTATTTLTATAAVPATINWFVNDTVAFTGEIFTPALSGTTTYTVIATDTNGCSETEEVTVSGGLVNIQVPDTLAVCLGEEILLSVTNLDPNDNLTYLWSPAGVFVPGTETSATPDYLETIGQQNVSVVVINQFGCTTTETVHLAVVDPAIDLSFTSMIDCNGGTVSFTNSSTAAFGYVWNFGDGTGPNFQESPVHTYANSGTYTVTLDIIYDVSCAEAFSMQVEVQEPQIFAGFTYDITECSADAAVIQFFDTSSNTLNNTNSWTWTFENATPATSTLQNPVVTVDAEGPLTVTLTIGTTNDCSNTISEVLEIDLVDLDISLSDTLVVCLGDAIQLNPNGDPDLTYSWAPVTGLDDPTATSPVATPLATTTYVATAYSTVGADTCFVTDSVVVFVPEGILLELDQEPVVVTCGETVVINATANVDIDVQWCSTIDGVIGTGSSISINPFRTDTIIAKATDEFGCMAMDTIIVVDNGVDITLDGGGDVTACQGVETTLSITNLDEDDILTYSWSPEENIVGPTDGSSVDIVVNQTGSVIFTAIVVNQFDCQDTVMFTVTVQDFQGEVADTLLVCYDEPTPINPGGNPDYEYNWSPTTGLDLSNPANPIATLTENQTYYVTITDPVSLCTDADSIVVIVQPDLDLQTTGGTQLCETTPVTLTATTAVAADVVWYLNGEIIGMGNTITVSPPNIDGCFTYTAIATDPLTSCEQSSSQEICLQIFTDELPLEDVVVCANEPTPINPGGDPTLIYTWTPEDEFIDLTNPWNPVVTTGMPLTYFVTVVDTSFGCSVIDTINIEIAPELNLSISPESIVLCEPSDVTLTANTDFPAASVNWFLLPGNNPLGTGTQITFMPPAGASQVYAVATSSDGCTERDTININNFPLDVAITDAIIICEPTATVDLSVFNNDLTQILTVVWEQEGVLTPLDQLTVTVDPNVTNNFSVTVTNQFGCSTVLNTSVTVINLLGDLSISVDPDTILLGESSTISVEGCVGCTYDWDPADDNSPIIVVTPSETGNNTYSVIVSLLGCELELETSVFVIDGTCNVDRVFLPNAFTPNNDGDNDVLHIRSSFIEQLTEVEFLIYNRWGEEMFRSQDPYRGWDGTYRGEQLAPDVYGFYLRVLCPNGDELVQKGNITILR